MKAKSAIIWIALLFIIFLLVPSISEAKAKRVGAVTVVKGKAVITHKYSWRKTRIKLGTPIYLNDRIRTDKNAKVRIVFIDQSIISIGSKSALIINEYVFQPKKKKRSSRLRLLWGKTKCYVNDFVGYRDRKFNVATSTTIVGVRGTVFLVWIMDGEITTWPHLRTRSRSETASRPKTISLFRLISLPMSSEETHPPNRFCSQRSN